MFIIRGTMRPIFSHGIRVAVMIFREVHGNSFIPKHKLPWRRYTGLADILDWYSTLLELADVSFAPKPDYPLDSVSLVRGFRGLLA